MLINLSNFLDSSDGHFSFKGKLEESESDLKERGITLVEPIEYEGEIFKVNRELILDLKISYIYEEACSRCLELSTHKIETNLSGKLIEGRKDDFNEEEYDYDDEEEFYYQNNVLNLKDDILNQVILSLPMKSLRSDSCEGLCSLCGINLNKDTCECVDDNIDPRLKELENFFPKK